MGKKRKKVVVLPCSGIGKVFGALARETIRSGRALKKLDLLIQKSKSFG